MGAMACCFSSTRSISLLSTIETALNDIWEAKTARPLLRQITDYTTLLVVTPLLMLAAVTLRSAAESSWIMGFLRDTLSLGDRHRLPVQARLGGARLRGVVRPVHR